MSALHLIVSFWIKIHKKSIVLVVKFKQMYTFQRDSLKTTRIIYPYFVTFSYLVVHSLHAIYYTISMNHHVANHCKVCYFHIYIYIYIYIFEPFVTFDQQSATTQSRQLPTHWSVVSWTMPTRSRARYHHWT